MAVMDVQFTKLPGWSCVASYFFITSHAAEYSMARSDQNSIRAAGGASSLVRNAGVKKVGTPLEVMLSQMACAARVEGAENTHCQ
eukprot:1149196-Pelagomonas_calceolata.AAC.4